MDEQTVKQKTVDVLKNDFVLVPEVWGKHLAFGEKVRIDFMAYPKPHLIERGFSESWFGIEAKGLAPEPDMTRMNRLIWQSLTYAQCEFFINGQAITPMFVLIAVYQEPKDERWRVILSLAQYGNVGVIELLPYWKVRFAGGVYFNPRTGKGNTNAGIKRHIGSFTKNAPNTVCTGQERAGSAAPVLSQPTHSPAQEGESSPAALAR